MPLHFAVLYGSVRSDRQGIRAARFILAQLQHRGHEATLVDPLEVRLPLLDRMYKEHARADAPPEHGAAGAALPRRRRLRDRQRRVQSRHPAGAEEPARPFPGGVFLPPLRDRLLLGRLVRRRSGGDAAADDPGRAGHGHHSLAVPGPQGAGRVRRGRQGLDPAYDKRVVRFFDELEWFAGRSSRHGPPARPTDVRLSDLRPIQAWVAAGCRGTAAWLAPGGAPAVARSAM